jgi:hypothetical protein
LVIVGDEDETEVAEIAEDLLRLCEGWEGVSCWFDFNHAALGALADNRAGCP